MRKLLSSSLIVMALGSAASAQASGTIRFDMNGAYQPGGEILVDTFDWAPDNSLVINGARPSASPINVQVNAQSSLATFIKSGTPQTFTAPASGTEYTFQLTMIESVTGIGTNTISAIPLSGLLEIFYDPQADANQLAGTGYGARGTNCDTLSFSTCLILQANVSVSPGSNGTFTDFTVLDPVAFPTSALDNFNTNNYPNVTSDRGSGNTNIDFNVFFAHPDFFLTNVDSLAIDMQDSSNVKTPFDQADPAALVVGVAPVFTSLGGGDFVNGQPGTCAANGQARCDFLLQTDAASTFNTAATVPEPSTLALAGFILLGMGYTSRRRHKV